MVWLESKVSSAQPSIPHPRESGATTSSPNQVVRVISGKSKTIGAFVPVSQAGLGVSLNPARPSAIGVL